MPHPIESLTVATDGASSGAHGPAGWAYVTEHGDWKAGSLAKSTNQVGELLGIHHAVADHMHVENLTVESDSAYAIGTYSQWMDAHARRGWKTADGKPTSNKDIIFALRRVRDERRSLGLPDVRLVKVKGHAPKGTHPLNEAADERAVWVKKTYAFEGVETTVAGDAQDVEATSRTARRKSTTPEPARCPASTGSTISSETLRAAHDALLAHQAETRRQLSASPAQGDPQPQDLCCDHHRLGWERFVEARRDMERRLATIDAALAEIVVLIDAFPALNATPGTSAGGARGY